MPPTTNKCLHSTQTSLSVRRTYPLAECGYPHIRLVCGLGQQSWLPQTTGEGHQGDPREHNCKFGSATIRCGGRAEQSVEEHTPCFHCLDTGCGHGLVLMLTAENDFGELEDYFVLSGASAKRRSVKFLGAAHVLVGEA